VRSSAEFEAVHQQIYRQAAARLQAIVAGKAAGTWAVSLDGDDTVLDNSLYARQRWQSSGSFYSEATWAEWIERRAASAMPGAAEFLRRVHALGGRIALVTNRKAAQCAATEDNLKRLALPYDVILCRGETSEKEGRWNALAAGTAVPGLPALEIVMWVGDNIMDFPDLTQEARGAEHALDDFGDRFIVLPNPIYGSWEKRPLQ
jgi:5'-nucleotidase (lipoprotein e(P4) family)